MAVSEKPRLERRRERNRAGLREAAKRSFERNGYTQTSVQDIIDEADITRRTFYRYFDSKDDVFGEILDQIVDDLCATTIAGSEETSLRARILARSVAALRIASENRAFLRAADEAIRVHEGHMRRWARLGTVVMSVHRESLDWCIRHDMMDPANTAVLAQMLSTLWESTLLDFAKYESDVSTIGALFVDVYWNALFRPHEGADDYILGRRKPADVDAVHAVPNASMLRHASSRDA